MLPEVIVREITLRIKNDQVADSIITIINQIEGIEIIEEKELPLKRKKSKIDEILENPYKVKDFKIFKREAY